ncbi:hypothetical protein Micbo1qcDRAFT_170313 [Microdochium bolleyi]|uniref:Uncharacterized protein n=1 Tax=Microdochium bolleyi TaxID=196109 RepID=A0A136JH70_9PEZI|nr:hypothetical protein Micbo1qcDRAFT_170313 [Microdochium bolleyi]
MPLLPSQFTEIISDQRMLAVSSILKHVQSVVEALQAGIPVAITNTSFTHTCATLEQRRLCSLHNQIILVQKLSALELWPLPDAKDFEFSWTTLRTGIQPRGLNGNRHRCTAGVGTNIQAPGAPGWWNWANTTMGVYTSRALYNPSSEVLAAMRPG